MNTTRPLVLASLATLLAVGCGSEPVVPADPSDESSDTRTGGMTWEEFLALTYQEPDTGVYIANGDEAFVDIKHLREFYEQRIREGSLIIHTSGGADVKWNDIQKLNLSYCISNNFGLNKARVVEALRQASDSGWEVRARVNFIYLPAQDANCTSSNTNVVFDVRPVSGNSYLARSFFPNSPRPSRSLLIDSAAFSITDWPLQNLLAHELGHMLGFRHEHTRPEAGRLCFEDTSWRPLTPYDSASIMHYPQCNGSNDDLSFSPRDRDGAVAVYGPPEVGPPPPPPPPPPTQTQVFNGTLVQMGEQKMFPGFSVVPGTSLTATLTGTGDVDLYVRVGAQPTLSSYNCRPYLPTSNEECIVTIPAGQNVAYVMLRNYLRGSASYSLRVTYTSPPP